MKINIYIHIVIAAFFTGGISKMDKTIPGSFMSYKDIIVYNTFRDTCMIFRDDAGDTIRFHRRFRILENTFTDTMGVALELMYPGQNGEIFSIQMDTATDGAMDNSPEYQDYLERKNLPELYMKYLCLRHRRYWKMSNPIPPKEKEKEYMKIRTWYKTKD